MRKTNFIVISAIIVCVLVAGCAAPQAFTTEITIPPTSTFSPLPVNVSPFYNAARSQINVGTYSQQLGASDFQELTTVAEDMARQRDLLTPEQMFVLAIRLFELGEHDDAVYWFYKAQFRAKLFQISVDPSPRGGVGDPPYELASAYNAFTQMSGHYINAYAGCDIENWISIVKMVKDDNPNPPDLNKLFPDVIFVEKSQWPF